MKKLSSETELIWEDNEEAFIKAGKDLKISQDIKILKTIVKCDVIEDKIELWDSFDYKYIDVGETKSNVFRLINMGMKVLLKYSKIYGYDYNLSIYNEDDWVERDPSFDSKEKLFENEGHDLCDYATRLVKQGEVMLCKENNKIKIQVVPSHVLYIINYIPKYIMHSLEDENYFSKLWGRKPSNLYYIDSSGMKVKNIWKILNHEPMINKIILKYFNFSELKNLLKLMEKKQRLESLLLDFQYRYIHHIKTQIDIHTDILVFIINDSIFPIKIDANQIIIQGDIMNAIKAEKDEYLLLKLAYMKSFNFSIKSIQGSRFSKDNQIIKLKKLFCLGKGTFVLLRKKDINKISNIHIEEFDRISEIIHPTKIKMDAYVDWRRYTQKILISKLNEISNSIKIELDRLYFCIDNKEDEFWKTVFRFNLVIIKLDDNEFIRIRKELNIGDQSIESDPSFTFWTGKTEEQIDFTQLWKYLKESIKYVY